MRSLLCSIAGLSLIVCPAHSQVAYYGRVGVTASTKLIRDAVVQEIDVQPALAPTIVLGASVPFAPTYQAGLEASVTSSGFHSSELGTETDLGTLRTGSLFLNLEGPLVPRLAWRAGFGVIRYWPADQQGIFLRGGSTRFLAGAGMDYLAPLLASWDLMISLHYDFHRFTTDELSARGFTGSQGVQRVSLSAGLARARR